MVHTPVIRDLADRALLERAVAQQIRGATRASSPERSGWFSYTVFYLQQLCVTSSIFGYMFPIDLNCSKHHRSENLAD